MFEHDNFPECIILHHSYSQDREVYQDWFDVYKWHVYENKWSYPGYHYGIETVNGEHMLMYGRPEYYRGAHTSEQGMNNKSIGICLIGNFDDKPPAPEMLEVLYDLIRDIYKRYGKQLPIKMHREYANYKSCPGRAFPIDAVRSKASAIWEEVRTPYQAIDHKVALDELSKRKLSNGEAIVGYPVQWQVKLLHSMVDSEGVKWMLRKFYKYLQENGL